MSDFQDEQGLGELPADLSEQNIAYVLPTNPASDVRGGQSQSGVLGLDVPNAGNSAVQFIFDSRPISAFDAVLLGGSNNPANPISYTVPADKILLIKRLEYVCYVAGTGAASLVSNFYITVDGVVVPAVVLIPGPSAYSSQLQTDMFLVVGSSQTVSFYYSPSTAGAELALKIYGNMLVNNGSPAYLQAAGAL